MVPCRGFSYLSLLGDKYQSPIRFYKIKLYFLNGFKQLKHLKVKQSRCK